jgi:hypothetical protein
VNTLFTCQKEAFLFEHLIEKLNSLGIEPIVSKIQFELEFTATGDLTQPMQASDTQIEDQKHEPVDSVSVRFQILRVDYTTVYVDFTRTGGHDLLLFDKFRSILDNMDQVSDVTFIRTD